ncbi:hypothetical protein GUITHDRAFT_163083 [Guillardia theta CCMP2712]|uniref:Uncharacterized protein n=3 Tax=Guillardia theta TaxID=55529 RepID=L1JBX7_GUITC|nr:hypothetical protein GUITHDRAFT_163083 [Guillardia theta CCMP2712]EKX46026.1 hypothetical protein GUITHDRAFT_163083 [Guillardia theta CCMP2712]|mmetsp:Transcript_52472/g.162852  ORF Transcript_52472/g.162852 Transcript_52472/m.162852 type:complete len:742 (+) Transcript_52472:174-2399(+)|eukprot:XP_005833006.1 hypothetical protein GUITHDRAFT_163083 [Guillardia theta CCMP2712]
MSLKQFPSRKVFDESFVTDHGTIPNERLVGKVYDCELAWEVLENRRTQVQEKTFTILTDGLNDVANNEASRIAINAGLSIDAKTNLPMAIKRYGRTKYLEFRAYVLFLVAFTVVTFIKYDYSNGSMLLQSAQKSIFSIHFDAFDKTKTFEEIVDVDDFWNFFSAGLMNLLFACKYDPKTMVVSDASDAKSGILYVHGQDPLIQPVRIRQLHVDKQSPITCQNNKFMSSELDGCWPAYKAQFESKAPRSGWPAGSMLQYQTGSQLKTFPFGGYNATMIYPGGGYVIDIPLLTKPEEVTSMIEYLKRIYWVDQGTRAVFIDIVSFNSVFSFYLSTRIFFEFMPYGDVRPSYSFRVFKAAYVSGQRVEVILYYMEYGFFALAMMHLLLELNTLRKVGIEIHYSNYYHFFNIVIYAFYFAWLATKVNLEQTPGMLSLNEVFTSLDNLDVNDFEYVGFLYNQAQCLLAFISLFGWLKLLEFPKYISRSTELIIHILWKCGQQCIPWFFILLIIILAYAQAFYLAFGPEVDGFESFNQALSTLVTWTFNVISYRNVISFDQFLASVLFISFQVTYAIILINMFVVTLMQSYYEMKNKKYEDYISSEIRKHARIVLLRWLQILLMFIPSFKFSSDSENDDELIAAKEIAEENAEQEKMNQIVEWSWQEFENVIHQVSMIADSVKDLKAKTNNVLKREYQTDGLLNGKTGDYRRMSVYSLQDRDGRSPDPGPTMGNSIDREYIEERSPR